MEEFEKDALQTAPHPPRVWGWYVDNTGLVNSKELEDELFTSQQCNIIKFTIEQEIDDNNLPMLDIRMIKENNSIITKINKKETHAYHYL